MKKTVSIQKYNGTTGSLRKAIELCEGFSELKSADRVLLKPNIFFGGGLMKSAPRFGVVTTAHIVEDTIILLKEFGCKDITIGEGTIIDKFIRSNTRNGFKWTGIYHVAKKYGAKLIDFHDGPFRKIEKDGFRFEAAETIFDCDFLINLPALKTHSKTITSLGMKNLKGCLSQNLRIYFHKKGLNQLVAILGTYINPGLTIIDGIYGNEFGNGSNSLAHRMDVIIAGKDMFSTDLVGTSVLGIDPKTVPIFKEYSRLTGRSINLDDIIIKGEKIKDVKKKLDWEIKYKNIFDRSGISGITIKNPDESICTGCVTAIEGGIALFCKDNRGISLDNVEVCIGENTPITDAKNLILLGNCAIKANRDRDDAIRVEGSPPKLLQFLIALLNFVDKKRKRRILASRIAKTLGTLLGVYHEEIVERNYVPPAFDESLYRPRR